MNKIFLSSILLLVVLVGCNVQVTDSITNKTKSINTGSKANIYEKYSYDCNNLGDHSKHDYALQQELTTQCQKKCCNGNYCEECSWPMMIRIKQGRRPWIFCFNPQCPSRKELDASGNDKKNEPRYTGQKNEVENVKRVR